MRAATENGSAAIIENNGFPGFTLPLPIEGTGGNNTDGESNLKSEEDIDFRNFDNEYRELIDEDSIHEERSEALGECMRDIRDIRNKGNNISLNYSG